MPPETPIVFIVDDDVAVRESLVGLLSAQGWQPEAFSSARGFLAHARARVPSCLVLDVSLPDLDGLDLQQSVAAEHKVLPVIFITGYGDVAITVRAMKAGAVEFLIKPFCEAVLVAAIEQALERSRAARGGAARPARLLRVAQPARATGHVAGHLRALEQAGRRRAGHQLDHRQGTPRPGDAQDERRLTP